MTDEPLTVCPACGGALRKVFAAPAISFKGSGFYATDHGKKSTSTTGDKPGEKQAAPAGSSDSKGEKKEPSKPAEKQATSTAASDTKGSSGSSRDGKGS